MMVNRKQNKYPDGWDEERVKRALAHYENQTESKAIAEDESASPTPGYLKKRASRADAEKYKNGLAQIPDVEPEEYDKL